MSLRAWWSRLRGTLRRDDALEREMNREMQFHLEMATKRNIERGMSADDALRQAKLSFGSVEAASEAGREEYRARFAENVVADARFALRALRRAPSFAITAMLTMALGIGASTAIFSVVDAVLLRPLSIPDPDDFAYLGWVWQKGGDIPALTAFQYRFVREATSARTSALKSAATSAFTAVAAFATQDAKLGDAAATDRIRGLRVNGDFFGAIGFAPRIGRAFDAAELETGGPVVILGDAVWRTRFGADTAIVGRKIVLEGEPKTVVGVMPASFTFPPAVGYDGYLVPMEVRPNPADEGHNTDVIARWRHGTSDAARRDALNALTEAFRRSYPALAASQEAFKIFSHRDVFVGGVQRTLWVLFGAVSLLLLIACANTATLLLVRASGRQREIAVRASIGAGPARILQQLLTEGLILAVVSAALGVVLSVVVLRAFLAAAPSALPAGLSPTLDGRVLAYALAISVVTGLVFGLAAAVPSFRLRLQSGLLGGARGTTGGGTRTRETLVFVETASAVVLLAGATILAASFARLTNVEPGFDVDRVVAIRLGKLPEGYDATRTDILIDRLLEKIRRVPGVEYAAAAPNLPLERGLNFPVDTRDNPELAIGGTELRFVSPDYFATLGVSLVGRDFTRADAAGSEPVAIVNQAFAKHFWGSASPIGRTIQIGHYKDRWLQPGLEKQTRVIGVATDMREMGLHRSPGPTVLVPRTQSDGSRPVLLVRGSVAQVANAVRAELSGEAPQLTPQIEPLSAVVSRSVAGPRFRTLLVGTFAGAALLLAAIGIYGVIAALVEQRRREIGIRLSLGASRVAVAVGVVRRCLMSVTAGAAAGLALFWVLRRSLASMLYETSTGDPRLLALAVAMLALVAALAALIPARRATHVDPVIALRAE